MDDSQVYMTLAEASMVIPGSPTIGTMWRWVTQGIRGGKIRLESCCVGGRRFVTRKAIDEFLQHCNEAAEESARACEHPRGWKKMEKTGGGRQSKRNESNKR